MRHTPIQITNPANMYFIAAELLIFPNTLFQSLSRIRLTPVAIDINSPQLLDLIDQSLRAPLSDAGIVREIR
jgi:hypothetical protein